MTLLIGKIAVLIVIGVLIPIGIGFWLVRHGKAKKARTLSTAPAAAVAPALPAPAPAPEYAQPPISAGGPPSLGRALLYIVLAIFALGVLGSGGAYLYFQHKAGRGGQKVEVAVDPCAKCKPLELVVTRMDDKDNYLWSGACTGEGSCDECRVPNCAASDSDAALKNCRCTK